MESRKGIEKEESKESKARKFYDPREPLPNFEDIKFVPPGFEALHQSMLELVAVVNSNLKPNPKPQP